jgi:hypothetical protein
MHLWFHHERKSEVDVRLRKICYLYDNDRVSARADRKFWDRWCRHVVTCPAWRSLSRDADVALVDARQLSEDDKPSCFSGMPILGVFREMLEPKMPVSAGSRGLFLS